jgi:hypothetical protein
MDMPSRETVLRGSIILIENIAAMPASEQSIKKKWRNLDFFMTSSEISVNFLFAGDHFEVQ